MPLQRRQALQGFDGVRGAEFAGDSMPEYLDDNRRLVVAVSAAVSLLDPFVSHGFEFERAKTISWRVAVHLL